MNKLYILLAILLFTTLGEIFITIYNRKVKFKAKPTKILLLISMFTTAYLIYFIEKTWVILIMVISLIWSIVYTKLNQHYVVIKKNKSIFKSLKEYFQKISY